ncbi:MAG: hypothetical protein U0794_17285 [Isosphaeraceae bacterium]
MDRGSPLPKTIGTSPLMNDTHPPVATTPTGAQRRRFTLAVVVFAVWVGLLGLLAVTSGSRPLPKPAVLEGR